MKSDKEREQEFVEMLKTKTLDELQGILVAYCSRERRLYSIKHLGFHPNPKLVHEEIFHKTLFKNEE